MRKMDASCLLADLVLIIEPHGPLHRRTKNFRTQTFRIQIGAPNGDDAYAGACSRYAGALALMLVHANSLR